MLRASSPAAGLAADLAGLTGLVPEPSPIEDLYDLAGAYTGLGHASPLTAEIVDVAIAAATAAMLIERPSSGGTLPRRAPRHDLAVRSGTWPDLPADGRARLTGLSGRPDPIRLSLAGTSALPADGQMCAVLAVDIAGFTRPDRDDEIRLYLHEKLYEYLQAAFDNSGLPWQACFNEDRGDGALVVVPPGISFKGLIHPLPEMLRDLIRRHNHVSRESAAIQLRIAAHIGPVDYDGHGFVGTDVNFAFRMLEARPVKRMLAASGAELCLTVSDYVYPQLRLPLSQPAAPRHLPGREVPGEKHQSPSLDTPARRVALRPTPAPARAGLGPQEPRGPRRSSQGRRRAHLSSTCEC